MNTEMTRMAKRQLDRMRGAPNGRRRIVIAVILLLIGLALAWVFLHPHAEKQPLGRHFGASGPVPVVVARAVKGDMKVVLNELGTVTPLATATVKTQIAGQIEEIAFREGQMVKKGDFLVQIDPRPYQLSLEQYQGQLIRDQALLKDALLDLDRYRRLVAEDSIAHQQLDTQESLVGQYKGAVATDQAMIDTARLNLAYCHITAPVDGRIGLRQVDLGNFVQPGDANGLAVVTTIKPITVIFTLPEDDLPGVAKRYRSGARLPVEAYDRAQIEHLADGRLDTMDNQIDSATGTVKMRAIFDNDDESLFPNQFVTVRLVVDTLKDAVLIPTSAVLRGAPGTFVYVVKDDDTVAVQPIKLGPADGEKVAVLSGLEQGAVIVTDGSDKLKDGARVALPAGRGDAPGPAQGAAGSPDAQPGQGDGKGGEHHHRHKDQQ